MGLHKGRPPPNHSPWRVKSRPSQDSPKVRSKGRWRAAAGLFFGLCIDRDAIRICADAGLWNKFAAWGIIHAAGVPPQRRGGTVHNCRAATMMRAMTPSSTGRSDESTVLVVDDDEMIREALAGLFRSVGLKVNLFSTAAELLRSKHTDSPSCLVLDVRLPGVSGLEFQSELAKASINIPIIFISGHGDIPMTVRAMKAGAVDFLTKPFRDQDMLDAVAQALERDRKRRQSEISVSDLKRKLDTLTQREREVMAYVTAGLMNKQVAGELGVTEITVKIHRGNAMRKMGAKSLADLVRMAELLDVRRPAP